MKKAERQKLEELLAEAIQEFVYGDMKDSCEQLTDILINGGTFPALSDLSDTELLDECETYGVELDD